MTGSNTMTSTSASPGEVLTHHWTVWPLARTLGAHATAWDWLLARMPLHHPMLESRFVDTMLQHFGDGNEHLCVLGPVQAPEAMCVLRIVGKGVWQSFLPSQAQVGPQLVRDAHALHTLFERLPSRALRIELLNIDPAVVPHAGYPGPQRQLNALTVNVRLQGSFDQYWAARSKNLRHNIRRHLRRAADDGLEIEHRRVDSQTDIAAAVSRYATLESAGWKGHAGTALSPGNAQESFFTDLLLRLAATNQSSVYEMWMGGKLVASRLVISSDQAVAILKTTFDESFKSYAPGRQQLHHLIEDSFERHAGKTLEFCTNATQDQLAWVDTQRHIEHWTLLPGPVSSGLFQAARLVRARFLRPAPVVLEAGMTGPTVDTYSSISDVPDDVAELIDSHAVENMQFGRPWFENLERTVYTPHAGLRYFVLRDEGAPLAVLPIQVEKRYLGNDALALGNFYTSLYSLAMKPWLRPKALLPLVAALVRELAPLRSIRLAPMDPDSTGFKVLHAALELHGLAVFPYFCFGNWSLLGSSSWETYLAGRDGQLRSTIRRTWQRLQQEGAHVELLEGGPELDRYLAAYTHVYDRSWKTAEPFPAFVPGLARLCAERGWLRLGIVWLNEQAIAAQLWIVVGRTASIFKLAHDEAYRHLSPGTALTAALMQQALDRDGVETVDYLTGDDAYKRNWMSHRRERWGLVAYNPRGISGLIGAMKEALGRAVKPWVRKLSSLHKGGSAFASCSPKQTEDTALVARPR